jgi:hypothetical protein
MAVSKLNPSAGGVPYGDNAKRPANPGIGRLYSNGEEKRLELYTSGGWQNIVSETPGVVSVSPTFGSIGSVTIQITGTNFTTGAIASVIGSNGVEIQAASTTVNSIVSITASFINLSYLNDPFDVKVTNTSNLFGLLPDSLNMNQSPQWQTSAGSLGTFAEQVTILLSALSATDPESSTITYSLTSGSSLPSGVTLNSSTGVISGTLPDISTDTTYTFTINASDGVNTVPRSFSITSTYTVPVEYLVVGGGGAGGSRFGGGGGAGGFRYGTLNLRSQNVTVAVGAGGTPTINFRGSNGGNSIFGTITSAGGGGGASENDPASNGGSGGGASYASNTAGSGNTPSVSPSQGFSGGTGQGSVRLNGGGGGSSAAGAGSGSRGNGGDGSVSSITGSAITYSGGGGAADNRTDGAGQGAGSQPWGLGGAGGGGAGGGTEGTGTGDSRSGVGVNGTDGLGGGGGGGAYAAPNGRLGGNGGSGVVIIAYPNTYSALSSIPGTLTYDQPTRSGYRVYRFTAGTGTVTF